ARVPACKPTSRRVAIRAGAHSAPSHTPCSLFLKRAPELGKLFGLERSERLSRAREPRLQLCQHVRMTSRHTVVFWFIRAHVIELRISPPLQTDDAVAVVIARDVFPALRANGHDVFVVEEYELIVRRLRRTQ